MKFLVAFLVLFVLLAAACASDRAETAPKETLPKEVLEIIIEDFQIARTDYKKSLKDTLDFNSEKCIESQETNPSDLEKFQEELHTELATCSLKKKDAEKRIKEAYKWVDWEDCKNAEDILDDYLKYAYLMSEQISKNLQRAPENREGEALAPEVAELIDLFNKITENSRNLQDCVDKSRQKAVITPDELEGIFQKEIGGGSLSTALDSVANAII